MYIMLLQTISSKKPIKTPPNTAGGKIANTLFVNVLINRVKNITVHNITAIGSDFFIISSIVAGVSSFCAFAGSFPHDDIYRISSC